jgi:aspartate kinase
MIVTKFGGTSVESAEAMKRCIAIVQREQKRRPLVVLSACAGVTTTLATLAQTAREGAVEKVEEELLRLRERHVEMARALLRTAYFEPVSRSLEGSFLSLRTFLHAVAVMQDLTGRAQDYVVSFGEQWSTTIFGAALRERDISSTLVDSRSLLVTDSRFTAAAPLLDQTRNRLLIAVPPLFEEYDVLLTQGFVGATTEGVTTTIGRGGSDYSAALFAALLDAEELHIWTDVDGILTADPSLVPTAMNIPEMTFHEASELAFFGARVLHPNTILPAVDRNIPVIVMNSRQADHPGTVIRKEITRQRPAILQSIAYKEGVSLLVIRSNRTMIAPAFLSHVFAVFGAHHTVVDVIVSSETGISLTVRDAAQKDDIVASLEKVGSIAWHPGRAVVTVVGEGLKDSASARSQVFATLAETGVTVELVSFGGSEIGITFVIREGDIAATVRALHKKFFEDVRQA